MQQWRLFKLAGKLTNWIKFLGREIPSFPRYWKRDIVNALMRFLPDDEVSAVLRAKLLKLYGFKVAKGAMVRQGVRFGGDRLTLGSFASIGACSHIDCHDAEVTLESHVVLSPKVTIVTGTHPLDGYPGRIGPTIPKPVLIKEGAWICVGAYILPGVTIGTRSVVAAGSVVTKDVPDCTMVAGVPARHVKDLD